jgi:hypothetical protein
VWGDSHATALLPAYEDLANRYKVDLYFGASAACRPLAGVVSRRLPQWRQDECLQFNEAMLSAIERIDPSVIVLSAHWLDSDADWVSPKDAASPAVGSNFLRGMNMTLDLVRADQRSVWVVLGVPDLPFSAPHALAVATIRKKSLDFIRVSRIDALKEYHEVERDFRQLSADSRVSIVDPKDALCSGSFCEVTENGRSLYRDTGHLSVAGAKFVSGTFEPVFAAALSR